MTDFHGHCHCGNITYVLRWPGAEKATIRKCDCSFCTRHGAAYSSHPDASLVVTVADPSAFGDYQFSTRTASFRFCARCGVLTFVTALIDGGEYAVFNVKTVDDFFPATDAEVRTFHGETLEERLARRRHTWIRDVQVMIVG